MANKNTFSYFPTHKDEIDAYIENLLTHTLKTNFEAEKLLLHSILHMMFDSTIPREELTPHTILHLLQMTAMEDDDGYTLLDKLYMATEERIEDQCVENLYWYMKETETFVGTVIRLISIYQFYDNLFDAPIYSDDGKTLIRYPSHLKDSVYVINDGVEKVASHAFSNNPHLNTIKIPKTLKSIEKVSFGSLVNLKAFIVNKENKTFFSENGVLYRNINNPVLIKYPPAIKNTYFVIPANIKKVKSFAFEGCNNLKEISFESGSIKLEDAAFLNCRHIDNIAILDGNGEMLNKHAFSGMIMDSPNQQNEHMETKSEHNANQQEQEANGITLEYHTPSEIKEMFDDYIVGHDDAKRTLAVAVYSHIVRCNNQNNNIGKSNIILCGPTGCGKTEFARTIAKCLKVPFVTADATSITETGMKGNDPTDMLKDLIIAADNDIDKAQNGIIYIDEIDKLATYGENAYRESYSKGVQQGLLKIIEGGIIPLRIDNPMHQYTINFDTSNILFIVGGAFGSLTTESAVSTKSNIGFVSEKTETTSIFNINKKLEAKDFVKYGMTQEFMGRFPVIVQLKQLTEDEIYRIMIEPKNSVITQYQSLVDCIGSKLVFEEDLLRSIAGNAIQTGTGARGIRTIIEQLVENIIFDLPNKKNIEKVLVHKGMLNNEPPKYIEHIKPTHTPKPKNTDGRPKRTDRADRPNRKNRKPRQENKD